MHNKNHLISIQSYNYNVQIINLSINACESKKITMPYCTCDKQRTPCSLCHLQQLKNNTCFKNETYYGYNVHVGVIIWLKI